MDKMEQHDHVEKQVRALTYKMDEVIDKLNDLEQIVYDFTGHIKP